MRGIWTGSLGLSMTLLLHPAQGQQLDWQRDPGPPIAPAGVALRQPIADSTQIPIVSLGRPIGESPIVPAAFCTVSNEVPPLIVRAQSADPVTPPPTPASPAMPIVPPPANERFNCGVVNEPPPSNHPILDGMRNLFGGAKNAVGGLAAGVGGAGRGFLESDHGFDVFSSPVSNPFLFQDPRALTEIRPIFIHQGTSLNNSIFHGGDVDFVGLQARVALTERWSINLNEIGFISTETHNTAAGYGSHAGWSELRFGPQYAFYRCEDSRTIASAGLGFDFPIGPSKNFQNTGNLSLEPYLSVGQNFLRSQLGSFNFIANVGYSVGVDNKRSDYVFNSYHLDYAIANKIYPFVELNAFYYTTSGKARPFDFEGRGLANFGSTNVSGHDDLSMAFGTRYKFSERLQTGLAIEFPLSGNKDLLDYGINFDVIWRW